RSVGRAFEAARWTAAADVTALCASAPPMSAANDVAAKTPQPGLAREPMAPPLERGRAQDTPVLNPDADAHPNFADIQIAARQQACERVTGEDPRKAIPDVRDERSALKEDAGARSGERFGGVHERQPGVDDRIDRRVGLAERAAQPREA